MGSIFHWLLGKGASDSSSLSNPDDPQPVREIAGQLASLPEDQARYVACFAYILGRVARVDHGVSAEEMREMEQVVRRLGQLPQEQAALVVRMAMQQGERFASTEDYLVTRQFTEISSPGQRRQLLDCLFAISAADDSISAAEEATIRQMASELRLRHEDYIAARLAYSDKREVMKLLRQ